MHLVNYLGDCASVDAIESRTLEFVAQLRGRLTRRRCKCATTFKNHYSDLLHVHLHEENDKEAIA